MKKILVASTALVAAGMITAGSASASEKIKLNLGGFSKWWVVGAWNDDSFQSNANTAGAQADYNSVDVKGDNEIWFGGSTTLDNGIQVGIDVQLEAGGHTDHTTDTIDESYVWIQGGFGKFIIGTENNGTYLLHVQAPDAAANWGDGGIMTGGSALATPTAVRGIDPGSAANNTTAISTDNDAEKITYVAPTFYGLTLGASYVPSGAQQDDRGATNIRNNTTGEIYGVGALYANTFGGVGLKVSAGYVTYDLNSMTSSNPQGKDGIQEYAFGGQLSYAGFTLGSSYRKVNADVFDGNNGGATTLATALDYNANAWDIGVQYASGPYAVSLAYYKSEAEGLLNTAGQDEMEFIQLSGKYNLGAGVDVLASVGHADYNDETSLDQNNNEGWTVMTGLSLQF